MHTTERGAKKKSGWVTSWRGLRRPRAASSRATRVLWLAAFLLVGAWLGVGVRAIGTKTYTVTTGTLPTGVTLASNGTLSGTPTVTGSFSITVRATDANGCPAIQNDLIGESLVKLETGHRATLPALGVAALGLGGATCNPNATTATLAFDGLSYNALPRALAVSGLASIANGYSSLLVVNRIGGNLGTGAATLGSLFGLLYDDQEASQSFTLPGNVCQLRGVLGNNFPRTVPRYTTVIPAGRSGWMKIAATGDEAIAGVLLVEAQNGLGGGHNLHHLTTSTATLTIPVYPAR